MIEMNPLRVTRVDVKVRRPAGYRQHRKGNDGRGKENLIKRDTPEHAYFTSAYMYAPSETNQLLKPN